MNFNHYNRWNLSKAAPTFDTTIKNFGSNRILNITDRSVMGIGTMLKVYNIGNILVPATNIGINNAFNKLSLPTFETIYNAMPSSGQHDLWSNAHIVHDSYQSNQLVPLSGLRYTGVSNGFDYIDLIVTTNHPIVIEFSIYNGHTEMQHANAFLIESTDVISIPVCYGLQPYLLGDYYGVQCIMTICYIGDAATLSKLDARINSNLSGVSGIYQMNSLYTLDNDGVNSTPIHAGGFMGITNSESTLDMCTHGYFNCQWNISSSFSTDQYLNRTEKYLDIQLRELLPEL